MRLLRELGLKTFFIFFKREKSLNFRERTVSMVAGVFDTQTNKKKKKVSNLPQRALNAVKTCKLTTFYESLLEIVLTAFSV